MLRNNLKAALAILGTALVPLAAQADQGMDSNQDQGQSSQEQPGYMAGEKIQAGQLPGAYNQSAGYMADAGWDVYLTGDYIYWDWVQDTGMNAGFNDELSLGFTNLDFDLGKATMKPGYASGFQVGAGFSMRGMDDWNFYGEYTWYRNKDTTSHSLAGAVGSSAVIADLTGSTDISIHYNNADFLLQRHFYFGKKLTANFYTGLKALWISSNRDRTLSGTVVGDAIDIDITSRTTNLNVKSWGLGPKFGFDSNWLLGYGFKVLGNISASVLYTRYKESLSINTVATNTVFDIDFPPVGTVNANVSGYGTIRPILETYLGLGWGSYFCDESFHLDISAGYDFNVHWNYVTDVVLAGYKDSSNLYLHGLNVQVRFDF